jgi:class 3 adenylate cyclase/tetratricopeptide (TPR) repeat protein
MRCQKCRFENPEDAKFCMECGSRMKGQHTSTDPILPAASDGERRQATVLFSDLSGYTAMTAAMDPEEVKNLMSEIFEGAGAVVEKYEVTVERFFGDEIMVLFGVPEAHEDDPARAIHAAIEIHSLTKILEEKNLGALQMHSGINTGLVITGDKYIGKGRHGLTGDTINLAKRLTGLAKPGEILVGSDTYLKAERYFHFQVLEPLTVKGKAEPLSGYKVLDARTTPQTMKQPLSRQISSNMVGRDSELRQLEQFVKDAISGWGGIVTVTGEAGIGKSRLVAEFTARDVLKKTMLLEGRAVSIGRNLPYHPIIHLLKNWMSIVEDDSEASALGKLESVVKNISGKEAEEIIPFVATLMGMKHIGRYSGRIENIEGEALEKLIFKNIRMLFIHASEHQPLVIVLDDMHWADNSSIELLEVLFRLSRSHPILIVTVFRGGYTETGERILTNLKGNPDLLSADIRLEALDPAMSKTLIHNILKIEGLPYDVKDRIVDRAGGNPFFIEEIVRSFIDEGAIASKNDRFVVTDKINTVTIPHTINDVLAARMDRLEPDTQELVKIASVIGRNFFHRILTRVVRKAEGIDSRLSYLKEIQLIREQKRFHELEYLFKHALAQEVAYDRILHQQRKQLHLAVAQAIETVFIERLHEFYGVLSIHYTRAEEAIKAEHYLVKAGEAAMRSSASAEALNYYQKGLQVYLSHGRSEVDHEKIAMFEQNIATAFFNKANWIEAVNHIDKVMSLYRQPTKVTPAFALILFFWNSFLLAAGLKRALFRKKASPKETLLLDLGYKKASSLFFFDSSRLFFTSLAQFNRVCRFDIVESTDAFKTFISTAGMLSLSGFSRGIARKILAAGKERMHPENTNGLISYKAIKAINDCFSGNFKNCRTYDIQTVDRALDNGAVFEAVTYTNYLSFAQAEMGEFSAVESNIEKLREISQTYDYNLATAGMHMLRTDLYIKKGAVRQGIEAARIGLAFALNERGMGLIYQIIFLSFEAEAHLLSGDLESAKALVIQAEQIFSRKKIIAPFAASCYQVARLMFNVKAYEKSLSENDRVTSEKLKNEIFSNSKTAVRKLRRIALRRTKTFRLIGEYYKLSKRKNAAMKWLLKSARNGESQRALPDLARTYMEIGRLLAGQNNGSSKAKAYFQKALALFKELELSQDIEKLEKIVSDFKYQPLARKK